MVIAELRFGLDRSARLNQTGQHILHEIANLKLQLAALPKAAFRVAGQAAWRSVQSVRDCILPGPLPGYPEWRWCKPYQFVSLSTVIEIALAVGLLSVIGGILPALAFLWSAFWLAKHWPKHWPGQSLRFVVAGAVAGLLWLMLDWPTRPGSAVWAAMVGRAETQFNLLWLFTGQILFAGVGADGMSLALVAAPMLGGTASGLVYAALFQRDINH